MVCIRYRIYYENDWSDRKHKNTYVAFTDFKDAFDIDYMNEMWNVFKIYEVQETQIK